MGITYLLPSLENAMEEVDLIYFSGQVAGVDVSCWIYSALQRGENRVYASVLHKVRLLYEANITPILVFDGTRPRAKDATARIRWKYRSKNLAKNGKAHIDDDKEFDEETSRASCNLIVKGLIKICKRRRLCWVQSPFEADVELVYLFRIKIINFVITEDSDLIVHAVSKILFKMRGIKGQLYDASKFAPCWGAPFDEEAFRAMCILLGCDYMPNGLSKFGIAEALKIYPQLSHPFDLNQLKQLVAKFKTTTSFWKKFEDAVDTFKYQPIYDISSRQVMSMIPYPDDKSSIDYPFAGVESHACVDHYIDLSADPIPFLKTCTDDAQKADKITRWCRKCAFICESSLELKNHRLSKHKFPCETCGRFLSTKTSLRNHTKLHKNILEHKCVHCGKEYVSNSSLKCHLKAAHGKPEHRNESVHKRSIKWTTYTGTLEV